MIFQGWDGQYQENQGFVIFSRGGPGAQSPFSGSMHDVIVLFQKYVKGLPISYPFQIVMLI